MSRSVRTSRRHAAGRATSARVGALLLVLAVLGLVLVVRPGGNDDAPGRPAASPSPSGRPTRAPSPSEEEWCHEFRRLADSQAVYAAAPDDRGLELIGEAADRIVALGVPDSMPTRARAGYLTMLEGVYGSLGQAVDPGAVPGTDPGALVPGSDQAFSSYLTTYCPP